MEFKKKYIFTTLSILIFATIAYFTFKNWGVIPVTQVEVLKTTVNKSVSASGKIKSFEDANLSFGASGTLLSISVKEGDTVAKNQILAIADDVTQRKTVENAKSSLDNAKKDLEIYKDTYDDNLEAAGGRNQYDRQIKKLENDIAQYQNTLDAQINSLKKYYIKSPIEGTVVDVNKKLGENAAALENVITVANLNDLYFEAEVDQEDLGSIKTGQKVKITLDAFSNKEFEGEVVEIPKFVDVTTTNLLVKVSINKNGNNVLYGMTGDAEIALEARENTTSLDFDAIFTDDKNNNKTFVYTLEGNKSKKLYVDLGLEGDRYTEILTNLDGKIIVIPQKINTNLKDGQKVQIVK